MPIASASFMPRPQKNSSWLSMRADVWRLRSAPKSAPRPLMMAPLPGRAVDEHAVPGHQHVVEDRDAVHLLEAAAERMIEARPRQRRHRLAADEREPRRVARDPEDEPVGVVAGRHAAERDHRDFLRDRRHGAEHLRAAHDDAVGRLPHAAQVQERLFLLGRRLRPVDLRVDQHVGEEEVVLADVLVVARGILAEARAAAREAVRHQMPARDELVHEVGPAAHEAEVVIRAQLEVLALLHEVFARVGHQERRRHGLAARRRRVGHHVAVRRIHLHVVLLGDGADRLLEERLRGDVGDATAAEEDGRRALLQESMYSCPLRAAIR